MEKITIPEKMSGVHLTGHGGFEVLDYREDIPVPKINADEVLIKVGACGVNNTDINTRIGWYSKKVTEITTKGGSKGFKDVDDNDASWSGTPLQFPRIQGADVAGKIVAAGSNVSPDRIGQRVLVRAMQHRDPTDQGVSCITFGSECDGGFAQYTKTFSDEAFTVNCSLTDIELASFPCAYSTAENMVNRTGVKEGDTVLITGASGGVGAAAIQLVKRRNAKAIAVCGQDKIKHMADLGADQTIVRGQRLQDDLGHMSVDVVLDMVAGPQWPELLDVLKRGGRYGVVGAIAGPIVELDIRTLYLKDLSFFGCTYQTRQDFENIVKYIENGDLVPVVAKSYPLKSIQQAQETFLSKKFVGKLVLVPSDKKRSSTQH